MNATEKRLLDFLSLQDRQFVIPVYQRNYSWKIENCEQLVADILEIASNTDPNITHFMGSIVYIVNYLNYQNDARIQYTIIDGQQRLTSLSLLLIACVNYLEAKEDKRYIEFKEKYLIDKYAENDNSKIKLKQSGDDFKNYYLLYSDEFNPNIKNNSKIITNYRYFKDRVNGDNIESILKGINKLWYIDVSLDPNRDDPQRIFESMNSTGLDLTQADLIRNFIIMKVHPDQQDYYFNEYWRKIEANTTVHSSNEPEVLTTEFFRYYFMLKFNSTVKVDNIYSYFKRKYSTGITEEDVNEIAKYSKYFFYLSNAVYDDVDIKERIKYFKYIDLVIVYPFYLALFNDYESNIISKRIFLSALDMVESYIIRRTICDAPTREMTDLFSILRTQIIELDYLGSLEKYLLRSGRRSRWPSDEEIYDKITERWFVKDSAKFILYKIESKLSNRYIGDLDDYKIEFIFPKKPSKEYSADFPSQDLILVRDKYLQTLGNLVLVYIFGNFSTKNSNTRLMEISQYLPEIGWTEDETGSIYGEPIQLCSMLQKYSEFGINEIIDRSRILAEQIINIWKRPKVDSSLTYESTIRLSLWSELDLTGYSLVEVSIDSNSYKVKNFAEGLVILVSNFVDKYGIGSIPPSVNRILRFYNEPLDIRSPKRITNGQYIETNSSTMAKIELLQDLFRNVKDNHDIRLTFTND